MMRELSAIGNRINQLAVKANALGFIDTPMLREEARKWHEFQIEIRKGICCPARYPNGGLRDMGCAWQARPPD